MSTTLYLLCRNDDALSLIIRIYKTQVVVPTLEQHDRKYIQHNTIHITVYEKTRQKNKIINSRYAVHHTDQNIAAVVCDDTYQNNIAVIVCER